jgi:hypothetical protein
MLFIAVLGLALAAPAGRAAVVSETWDTNGPGWPSQWDTSNNPGGDTIKTANNRGYIYQSNETVGSYTDYDTRTVHALINSAIAQFTDSVQEVDIEIHNTTALLGGFVARASGGSEYRGYLYEKSITSTDYWNIYITRNGVELVKSVAVAVPNTAFGHLKFTVQDVGLTTHLSLTYTDPAGIQTTIQADDSSPLAGPGQVGIYAQTSSRDTRFVAFDNYTVNLVPEPGMAAVVGMGLAGWLLKRRRRGFI